jgi:CheY-like chemotaxis protein/HPt (histidine-containing phosphotransfer) domain-containing protein
MGGEVEVDSTVGIGSRFVCTIPFVLAGEVRATGYGADRRAGGRLVGARLLVVDDSDVNREVARRILELEGAWVDTAASGAEAIGRVQSGGYDAVLMDIQMEDMDGVEATQRIRALPDLPRLPILAVTAWALASERERAIAAGVDDFVSKPFEPVGLVLRIREHVERHRGAAFVAGTASFAPPRQQSAASAWPVLDGVDVREASARFGDDQALYRTLLGRLLEEFRALDVDDTSLALRAHKLRGSAGNLGARGVEQAARALEETARAHDLPGVERALQEVHAALARVDRAARDWTRGETPEPRDIGRSDTTWADIERLLASNDLRVIDLLPGMTTELAERLGPAPLEAFGRAIDALDFQAALQCFRAVA